MRPTSVTVSSATSSAWIPVNWRQNPFNLGIQVTGTGTHTWNVEYTADDIYDSTVTPTAITAPSPLETGAGGTAELANLTVPCRAVRLKISSWTSGSSTMTVFQGS